MAERRASLWERFLNLVYPEPNGCLFCGAESPEDPDLWICPECESQLLRHGPSVCRVCGRTTFGEAVCRACVKHGLETKAKSIRILYQYQGLLRDTIHGVKFNGRRLGALALAHLLAREVEKMEPKPERILFVPSHVLRDFQRGYSVMGLTARELSRLTGIPAEPRALKRVRYGRPMYKVAHEKRFEHIRGAYAKGRVSVSGKNCLLIDDICTSGATLRTVLEALDDAEHVRVLIVSGPMDTGALEEKSDL